MILIIGNKRYSSWSLRPWVLMKHFGIAFEEKLIPLNDPDTHANIIKFSPSGKVPALIHNDTTIWDSMAIAEHLNECFPEKQMWPKDAKARATARSVSNEMHSGFATLREHMPHDLTRVIPNFDWSPANADIERIKAIWTGCLQTYRGPFLFGEYSIADAMFAPVANRFVTYGVPQEGVVAQYVKTLRALPEFLEWQKDADAEKLRMPRYE